MHEHQQERDLNYFKESLVRNETGNYPHTATHTQTHTHTGYSHEVLQKWELRIFCWMREKIYRQHLRRRSLLAAHSGGEDKPEETRVKVKDFYIQ